MIKRILLACAAIVICAVLMMVFIPNPIRFHQTLEVSATVNGETLDLQGTSVKYDIWLAHTEPPRGREIYNVLGYYDGIFRIEYTTEEYWNYYFDFMLPSELTGFSKNIYVHIGEHDAIAWEEGAMSVDLDLNFTDSTKADAVLHIDRTYDGKGKIVHQEESLQKELTPDDASLSLVTTGHLWDD